jgi:ACS family tartrate transporter-like MFS transporter
VSVELERATMGRVVGRLLPFLLLLYFVSWLDRANLTFAAKTMRADLGIGDAAYGFGAGIFYIGYSLFEVPSNLILARVGARFWIARIMISWGLISAAMMFVQGPTSFYSMRFLLGVAEAGFLPGIIYYLGHWFPAHERAKAVSYFMTAIPLSIAIGAPISGALLQLDGVGGLHGWQWMYLVEGLPAIVLGFVVFGFLTERPAEARWLSAEQRDWLTRRIEADNAATEARHRVPLSDILKFKHPVVWMLALIMFACQTGSYGLTYWVTQVLEKTSTLSHLTIVLLTAVPYAAAALSMVLLARSSDRSGERILHVAIPTIIGAAGFVATGYLTALIPALIALTIAAMGDYSTRGPFWAMPGKFLSGTAAAAGIGFINSFAAIGGFVGPYAVGLLAKSTGSLKAGMWLLALVLLAGSALTFGLRRRPELTHT